MKQKNFLVTIAIVLATLIICCAEDDFQETAGMCPMIIDKKPDSTELKELQNDTTNFISYRGFNWSLLCS